MKRIKSVKPKAARRSLKIEYRVNEDEYAQTAANSKACGLTMSDYCRKVNLGYKPKYRMTEREIEAFNKLGDARGDLVKVANALKGLSNEQRLAIFRNDQAFMRAWIDGVNSLINQWDALAEEYKD